MAKKQISILVEEKILAEIDAEAERMVRSRNWVIGARLENSRTLPPLFSVDRDTGVVTVVPEEVGVASRKKIADISNGGGAQVSGIISKDLLVLRQEMAEQGNKQIKEIVKSGGIPDLPAVGKAQDGVSLGDLQEKIKSLREMPGFQEPDQAIIYGRSGIAPDFNEVIIPKVFKPRSAGLSDLGVGTGDTCALPTRQLPDGVPCGHAGCLSHLSHPCEGCGRIGGRRPIYNMEDNAAQEKFLLTAVELKKIADESPGGFSTLSPEMLAVLRERAAVDGETAKVLHQDGLPLDREILVRWGLAENYKPKLEDVGGEGKNVGGENYSEARSAAGKNRRNPAPDAKSNHGGKSSAVAIGKSKVNMEALRDICAGNIPDGDPPPAANRNYRGEWVNSIIPEPHEVDLCGFKSYNEIDGENYVCGKEVHGPKVKHGDWIKI